MSTILTFYGTERSDTEANDLTAYLNEHDEISIVIKEGDYEILACLDKATTEDLIDHLVEQVKLMDSE